jgi:thioredoxin-dependent peroxiredoxin
MIKPGETAPAFSTLDQDGKTQTLSMYVGKWVILYFYPRDDTPGCTKEACNFRDSFHQLEKFGVVILGVSKDTVLSHKKFAQKYHLNFPLLADPDKTIIQLYDAWGKKKFMGREFEGTIRMTYLINPKGRVEKVYEKVNPLIHAGEVIRDLEKK